MSRNEILISLATKNGFMISIKNGYNRHFRDIKKFNTIKSIN